MTELRIRPWRQRAVATCAGDGHSVPAGPAGPAGDGPAVPSAGRNEAARAIRRIHIIGGPGSGKTTVSRKLAELLHVPVFELDEIAGAGHAPSFHLERPLTEREADLERIRSLPGWITEGTYLWWTDDLMRAADLIIWLDVSRHVAIRCVLIRHAREYGDAIRQAKDLRSRLHAIRYPHLRHLRAFVPYTWNYYQRPAHDGPIAERELSEGRALSHADTRKQLAAHAAKVLRCTDNTAMPGLLASIAASQHTSSTGANTTPPTGGPSTMTNDVPPTGAMTMVSRYAEMHKADGIPENYDGNIYRPNGYDSFVWDLYRPYLVEIVRDLTRGRERVKYLDFACGTGRIISTLEMLATDATGVDISPQMLSHAQTKVAHSTLKCVDILAHPDAVDADYDLITAFRFFLNTEPEMRSLVMRSLASRLAGPNGRLIFNVHANSWSADAIQSAYQVLRGWGPTHCMSYPEVRRLVEDAGLEIERWYGFGLWPHRLYTSRLGGLVRTLDRGAARLRALRWISHDMLFVCRPRTVNTFRTPRQTVA